MSTLSRGAAISAGLHAFVLLALILVIPHPEPPPPPPEDSVEVEFEGKADSAQKSEKTGKVAAPAEAEKPAEKPPAIEPPKPQPEEAPPPPPPPPPPPQQQADVVKTLAPAKIPPPPPSRVAQALKPPPPVKIAPPPVKPPPQPAKPVDTVTHQPNPTKNPAPDTKSLENTLEKLLADQKQDKPPTRVANPSRGGVRDAGGQKHGNLTGALSEGQRKTVGDSVRRCYAQDTAAKDYASYMTIMTVTVDATGEVRDVQIAPADRARAAGDPPFRAFTERAAHAVLDPQCAKLPLPPELLGKTGQLTFRFRP